MSYNILITISKDNKSESTGVSISNESDAYKLYNYLIQQLNSQVEPEVKEIKYKITPEGVKRLNQHTPSWTNPYMDEMNQVLKLVESGKSTQNEIEKIAKNDLFFKENLYSSSGFKDAINAMLRGLEMEGAIVAVE